MEAMRVRIDSDRFMVTPDMLWPLPGGWPSKGSYKHERQQLVNVQIHRRLPLYRIC